MYNELKTGDDAWMKSVHERIDRLSVVSVCCTTFLKEEYFLEQLALNY